jgi:hypothetical protein
MRRTSALALGALLLVCHVGIPVRAETFQSDTPPFSIDYPKGWKIRDGEGGLRTRAVGPGSAMNVSVAAASRPDFDADSFSADELEQIADGLVAATAGALKDFQLIERGRAQLGGKPAAYFVYRAVVEQPDGHVKTVGLYYATAHRGLVYSVTGVTQERLRERMEPAILRAIRSFRFGDASAPADAK